MSLRLTAWANARPSKAGEEKRKYFSMQWSPIFEKALLFKSSQASPVCPSGKSDLWMKMSVEHWWNDFDKGNPHYPEKNLSQFHSGHHKCHMYGPGLNPGPLQWQTRDLLPDHDVYRPAHTASPLQKPVGQRCLGKIVVVRILSNTDTFCWQNVRFERETLWQI